MNLHIILIITTIIGRSSQLTLTECNDVGEARRPEYNDIAVTCGTDSISLAIQACPVVYTGYNVPQLSTNNNNNSDPDCIGISIVSPRVGGLFLPLCSYSNCTRSLPIVSRSVRVPAPVFFFSLPFKNDACGSRIRNYPDPSTGVQTVNISGFVSSSDPTTGTITYNAELKYYYSCSYPLEYVISNTQIDVSASSIVLKDKNGSFVSTLRMKLFSDVNYSTPLVLPENGIELRKRIYVEVKAINLTEQYNVLLDRCYASISPLPSTASNSSFFNLIMPCNRDQLTTMIENGVSQSARFSFPAFRFMEQQDETVSTYYLHCITRLCEVSTCSTFLQCNKRRRRSMAEDETADSSHLHTITSPEIVTQTSDESGHPLSAPLMQTREKNLSAGLGAAVGVLAFVCIVVLCIAAIFYKKLRN